MTIIVALSKIIVVTLGAMFAWVLLLLTIIQIDSYRLQKSGRLPPGAVATDLVGILRSSVYSTWFWLTVAGIAIPAVWLGYRWVQNT